MNLSGGQKARGGTFSGNNRHSLVFMPVSSIPGPRCVFASFDIVARRCLEA